MKKFFIWIVIAALLLPSAALAETAPEAGQRPICPGDYITFGHYPQTAEGNDTTPIEWLVLDVQGEKALLLSRYGLDAKPYNIEYVDSTWETCTLRAWLNGEFMNKAFSGTEQNAILTTNVDNSISQGYSEWSMKDGNNTQDKIFLLSCAEARQYLAVEHDSYDQDNSGNYTRIDYTTVSSRLSPTAYTIMKDVYTSSDDQTAEGDSAVWWWLRSPGIVELLAACVYSDGSLTDHFVSSDHICVRPAMWIDLNSGIF